MFDETAFRIEKNKDWELWTPQRYADYADLKTWIDEGQFLRYETPTHKVERATSNRVSVYMLTLPWNNREAVMKVSAIHPRYTRRRKAELLVRNLIRKDHNLSAFEACWALGQKGIAVATPLAYWRTGFGMQRKSYFLYEKIDKGISGKQLVKMFDDPTDINSKPYKQCLLEKLTAIARSIHDVGWRHGDLDPKNFLLDAPGNDLCAYGENLKDQKIYLIDYDKCRRAKIRFTPIKTFYDLQCLRGLRLLGLPYRDILTTYQNGRYSHFWHLVLLFWIRGGFNLSRWLNRHLHRAGDSHLVKPD